MELVKHNFKRLRKDKTSLTQEGLAEAMKVDKSYIGQIEAGSAKAFSAEAEEKWAKFFGVSIAEFFLEPGQAITDVQKLLNMMNKPETEITDEKLLKKQSEIPKQKKQVKKKVA